MYEGKISIPVTDDEILHIHHWIIYLVLIIFIPNYVFFGFAATMIIQGLSWDYLIEIVLILWKRDQLIIKYFHLKT
jgi:hypothetical protein